MVSSIHAPLIGGLLMVSSIHTLLTLGTNGGSNTLGVQPPRGGNGTEPNRYDQVSEMRKTGSRKPRLHKQDTRRAKCAPFLAIFC